MFTILKFLFGLGALAGFEATDLGLLEIGGHPDLGRDDRQQGLARRHRIADADRAAGDIAGDRGGDHGTVELRLGLCCCLPPLGVLRGLQNSRA